jgi:hypothetical protein
MYTQINILESDGSSKGGYRLPNDIAAKVIEQLKNDKILFSMGPWIPHVDFFDSDSFKILKIKA